MPSLAVEPVEVPQKQVLDGTVTKELPNDAIEGMADYEAAKKWIAEFRPKENVEYDWINSYAERYIAQQCTIFQSLDGKADSYLRYFGILSAVALVFTVFRIDVLFAHFFVSLSIFLVLALSGLSFIFVILARSPASIRLPPTIKEAVFYAEYYKNEKMAQAAFLSQWHVTSEGMRLATARKARLIQFATVLFVVAFLVLVGAVGIILFTPTLPAAIK